MQKDINKKRYSLGDILSSSWRTYKNNFKLFLIVSLIVYLPLNIILNLFGFNAIRYSFGGISLAYFIISVILIVIVSIVGFIIPIIATIYSVDKLIKRQKVNYKEALNNAFSKFFTSFWTYFLMVVCLIGLFLLLIVPGVIFAIYWTFAISAVVLRNKSGKKALNYSKEVVKKRWWRVLGISLVIGIIIGVITGIINGILLFISSNVIMAIVAETLVSLIGLFSIVAMTIFFINLDKIRAKNK